MFVAIAKAPIEIKDATGKSMAIHPLFVQYLGENQEVVPVFLSKLQAYIYLKPAGFFEEYQLVTTDSVFLKPYQNLAKWSKEATIDTSKIWCQIALGILKNDTEYQLGMYDKKYSLKEIFFSGAKIEQEIADFLGDKYQIIVENNQLTDEEIVKSAEEFINSTSTTNQPSSLTSKLKQKFKTIFTKSNNKLNKTKINEKVAQLSDEDKQRIEEIAKQNLEEDLGSTYGFVLKNKDGTLYAPKETDNKHVIAVFINKLDAVIFAHGLYEKEKIKFDIAEFNGSKDTLYFKALKKQDKAGIVRFRIIYGFLGTANPFGTKWATYYEKSDVPSLLALDCTLADVENGIDLRVYFSYVHGKEERETAIAGLIKTNLTPTEELKTTAENLYTDMKANLVVVEQGSPEVFHRVIAIGI